ncbi:Glu/Leu/Phe/Val dehydrogenase [Sinimarinibacterium sp. CAU 1509]|uniref:Glu/Leu/Phe/Val family dehydrogenase n=1 Tax=Sinimarinibacterium sp. CAU 1509 TaxID=2562283 RepID=UPI0010ABA54A|nr:Glu/Leu/Phe/Val dehydrogenase [Sinimarinibacterium sp. CAU 1509]TJY62925.1 Glu/Leu/Phe/Val dehydrogenase [Sinimarinibacterium sp. CAU 1509]
MSVFDSPAFDAHEGVHCFHDAESGLRAIIAVHSTALGPAAGGCRLWSYASADAAMTDALRLSRGMSYKNAVAGLPLGGGKAVILRDPQRVPTPALFEAFGRVVDQLGGRYVTAEDVGVSVADMEAVARRTRHVCGLSQRDDGSAGGDPSPKTAYGVFCGIRAAVRAQLGRDDVAGLRIAVQGLGHVGWHLCELLHAAGARLVVADLNAQTVERARAQFGAETLGVDRILFAPVDVLAPCALGAILNAESIPQLQTRIVAGAANNQLATDADGERLRERGILYAPDYVINAGGIINAGAEYLQSMDEAAVMAKVAGIEQSLLDIFDRANELGVPTHRIADELARRRIEEAARMHRSTMRAAA